MSTKLGTLTLDLVAKIGGFEGPIEKARRSVKKKFGDIRKDVNTAAKAFAGLAAASATAAAALLANSASNARELRNLADIANTGVEDFQSFAFAAETVGVEQDKLSDILKDTTDRVGDFLETGGGPMADFFENIAPKIGVTADQFRNLSGKDALQLYVDSLNKANLSQEEMTFYMEAVASDATALIPLLRDNGKELQNLEQRADDLGLVLSQVEVEQLAGLGDDFSIATQAMGTFISKVGANLAPIVSAVSDEFFNAADGAVDMNEAALDAYEGIVDGSKFVINAVDGVGRVFKIVGNLMVATVGGALQVISGGIALILDGLNKIPSFDIAISDNLIADLREFRDVQADVANFAVDEVQSLMTEQLAGDKFKDFINERVGSIEDIRARVEKRLLEQGENDALDTGLQDLADKSSSAADSQEKLRIVTEQLAKTIGDASSSKAWQDIFGATKTDARAADFDTYAQLVADDIKSNSRFAESNLQTLKQILQTSVNNGNSGLSENGVIEDLDVEGMSEVVKGLEQMLYTTQEAGVFTKDQEGTYSLEDLSAESSRTANATEKLVEIASREPEPVGTLKLTIAGPNGGQLETQIQANTSSLQDMQSFIDQFTNDQARADGA